MPAKLKAFFEQAARDLRWNAGFAAVSNALLHVPRIALFDSFVKNNFLASTVALPVFDAGGGAAVKRVGMERMDQGVPAYTFAATVGENVHCSVMTKHHLLGRERMDRAIAALAAALATAGGKAADPRAQARAAEPPSTPKARFSEQAAKVLRGSPRGRRERK